MIFVNFKSYEQGSGANALHLISVLEKASQESQIKIVPVLQAADIREATMSTKLEIWGQHVDPVGYGAHTGSTIAESLKEDGAMGSFLNHSEHKFASFEDLATAHERCVEVDLKTLIFAADMEELKQVASLNPNYISYEPPELVGSTETSVSEAEPRVIEEASELARKAGIPLIVGAGIKSSEDIHTGLALGAIGFAIASSIVKADDPKSVIDELLGGYTKI